MLRLIARPWTKAEDEALTALWHQGKSTREIALKFRRTQSAV